MQIMDKLCEVDFKSAMLHLLLFWDLNAIIPILKQRYKH